ncbi:MAG: hypothetical protein AAFN81_34310 [Bacteroidota bacterium]
MKMQYQIVLSLILFALPFTIAAQGNTNGQGGDFTQQHLCLPESQRDEIKQQLAENIRLLGLDETNTGRAVDDLKFPCEQRPPFLATSIIGRFLAMWIIMPPAVSRTTIAKTRLTMDTAAVITLLFRFPFICTTMI